MLALVDAHADVLDRSCRPGHLTGSACVIEDGTDRTLLLWHRKLQRWLQPGGHADGDGDLARVALREATEETGIASLVVDPRPVDLDIHRVAPPDDDPHEHLDVRFVVLAPRGSVPVGNHESEALRWVRPDELAPLGVDPGLGRLVVAAHRRRAVLSPPGPTRGQRSGDRSGSG